MSVFLGIVVMIMVFFCILMGNTFINNRKARKLREKEVPPVSERYVQGLAAMIRCRTVSYKDHHEDTEFAKLRDVVRKQFPLFFQKAELHTFRDDCWMYKLPGADETRNMMLMSHHDVVDAPEEWKYPPFDGISAEGKLWGRGTVDTKTPLFAEFMALEELLEQGFTPAINVWIGSSHNEEYCGDGVPEAKKYFEKEGITFEVILDEGGAVIVPPIGGMDCERCAMVAVHEKGRYHLMCTANAQTSHASLTAALSHNPAERMAAFVHHITTEPVFIRRINPQFRAMLKALSPYCRFPMNVVFSNLWLFGGLLKKIMPKLSAQAGGLIGTTCSFLDIQGNGTSASAHAFLRPVDEQDLQEDLKRFEAVAEKYGIAVTIREDSEYHVPADMTLPPYGYLMDTIARHFPDCPAAPFILPAGTDARTFTEICPCVLRFAPIRLSSQQLAAVHSKDENIDLTTITEAVAFYRDFVARYA